MDPIEIPCPPVDMKEEKGDQDENRKTKLLGSRLTFAIVSSEGDVGSSVDL